MSESEEVAIVREDGDEVEATLTEIAEAKDRGDIYFCEECLVWHVAADREFRGLAG